MNAIIILINSIMDIYIFSLLAYVIASWLISFRIVNPWQPFVRMILQSMGRLHEPLLSRIRSVLPELGGIDLSPIIVFLAIQFLRNLMFEYAQ
jgi:YggT family protein